MITKQTRAKKNSCTVFERNGMLNIRFRYQGELFRKSLSLPDNSANRAKASQIASTIELKILTGTFELSDLDDLAFNKPKPEPVVKKVRKSGKDYPKNPKRDALSPDQVSEIIQAFYTDRFVSKYTRFKHSQYAKYVHFLFLTACRPSEAIGLQAKDVDWSKGRLHITKALARSVDGKTASKHRRWKDPKTRSGIRTIPLNDALRQVLEHSKRLKPDDLVFPSPTGQAIDDHNFIRVWRKVLEGLGIDYHVPYAIRHTRATTLIESGLPVNQVSYLIGHANSKITLDTYVTNRSPDKLPDL